MCGRFVQKTPLGEIRVLFGASNPVPNAPPRYNAAPTDTLAVVRYNPKTSQRSLDLLRWGLVPLWAKDPVLRSEMHQRAQRDRCDQQDLSRGLRAAALPGPGRCVLRMAQNWRRQTGALRGGAATGHVRFRRAVGTLAEPGRRQHPAQLHDRYRPGQFAMPADPPAHAGNPAAAGLAAVALWKLG